MRLEADHLLNPCRRAAGFGVSLTSPAPGPSPVRLGRRPRPTQWRCCAGASSRSRVSRATSVWPRDERPGDTASGALPPFPFNALRGRALAGVWPALERLFIACTRMSCIVVGHSNTGQGPCAPNAVPCGCTPCAATPERPVAFSLRQQTRPAAFLRRFSPLLEAEYLSDVARCRFKGTLGSWLRNDDGA
jgi:hypothetical protein